LRPNKTLKPKGSRGTEGQRCTKRIRGSRFISSERLLKGRLPKRGGGGKAKKKK